MEFWLKTIEFELERNLDKKFRNYNLVFARLTEETDSETNRKKEDRNPDLELCRSEHFASTWKGSK
jgi:hypothetical protein